MQNNSPKPKINSHKGHYVTYFWGPGTAKVRLAGCRYGPEVPSGSDRRAAAPGARGQQNVSVHSCVCFFREIVRLGVSVIGIILL